MSKAGNMVFHSDQCHRFLESFVMQSEQFELGDCEHGHMNCSTYDGGPCSDELSGLYEEHYGEPFFT